MIALILILLIVVDIIWFKFSLQPIYTPVLGNFTFRYQGVIAWVLLAYGINKYVLSSAKSAKEAALEGSIFGLIVYGVYNATNYATLDAWTPKVWLVDNLWGGFVCALVSYFVYEISLKKK